MIAGQLGCADDYQAVLHRRGGTRALTALTPVAELSWERRLSGQATASVVIAKNAVPIECCRALGEVSPWAHELSIYREGDLVWQGPVVQPLETRDTFTINAVDITAWLDVRACKVSYVYSSKAATPTPLPPTDVIVIAQRLLNDTFATDDDTNIRPFFVFTTGGLLAEQGATAKIDIVGDLFKDLANQGMEYTTIGRRLLAGPTGMMAHAVGRALTVLTDEQLGAGIEVSAEGSATATQFYNHASNDDGAAPVVGSAGGYDAYYGLVQRVVELNEWTGSVTGMNALARQDLGDAYPAPLVVRVADDATLHPNAPITVADLICGVRIDVGLSTGWCRQVNTPMRLAGVSGTWTSAGERIGISLEEFPGGVVQPVEGA